jgi:hypothetical protein
MTVYKFCLQLSARSRARALACNFAIARFAATLTLELAHAQVVDVQVLFNFEQFVCVGHRDIARREYVHWLQDYHAFGNRWNERNALG